ncbi:aldo-keto reductase family 1 member C3-like isoform X2 [Tiliqua scincoides]|uniref:aldo-keto reductase family 1 member C3-like isoform X2 n=1 Tax=Tiliqua scincoides TaxID=71010 RepID=UPI003461DB36
MVEKRNDLLQTKMRALLADSNLGRRYWVEAVLTANYIINCLWTSALNKTPYKALYGQPPSLKHMLIFGVSAWVNVPRKFRRKRHDKSLKLTFLGYEPGEKAYRFCDRNHKLTISCSAVFNEQEGWNREAREESMVLLPSSPAESLLQQGDKPEKEGLDSLAGENAKLTPELPKEEPKAQAEISAEIPRRSQRANKGIPPESSYFHRTWSKFQPLLSNRLNLKEMALGKDHVLTMNDGNKIPVFGFGTYCGDSDRRKMCEEATKIALEVGFRHIDGAYVYETEEQIGRAVHAKIADGTLKREDIFYTGKLWSTFHRPELVRTCLEQSLKKLQFDYMDLFLIHNPYSLKPGADLFPLGENKKLIFDKVDLRQTWEAMEACKDAGLVKSIGVSNFNLKLMEMILNKPGLKYKPVINQVECHIYQNQSKMLNFCKSNNILLEAYSVLGTQRDKRWVDQNSPVLLEDPVLAAIAKKYKQTPALVALRHQLQRGLVVLVQSFIKKQIEENMQVFDFHLSEEDMKSLDGLHRNMSYLKPEIYAGHHLYSPPEEN